LVVDRRPKVSGVVIRDHLARILVVLKVGFDERDERPSVGSGNFRGLVGGGCNPSSAGQARVGG
jgi:hypothetical protein